jgi:ribose transport system substrate-binding protein
VLLLWADAVRGNGPAIYPAPDSNSANCGFQKGKSNMFRSNFLFLGIAAIAIAAALWYRQQVFQLRPTLPKPSLAFITGGSGPYWQITARGARSAADKYNIDLKIEMPADEESLQQQMAILTRLDYDKLNGIALSPLDAEGQTQLINRIQRHTNVVTFDSDAPLSNRRAHVGTSNYGAGVLCAQLVAEALPNGGKVLVLLANLTKENLIDRKSGFEESLNKILAKADEEVPADTIEEVLSDTIEEVPVPELTVVDFMTDNGDANASRNNIRDTLSKHPDLACIVGMNAKHGAIIRSVLEAEGKLGEIQIVAFDEEAATLDGIEAGHIYATIAQDPYKYGHEATRMLYILYREGSSEVPIVGGGTVHITAEAIRKKELKAFRERLGARADKEEI